MKTIRVSDQAHSKIVAYAAYLTLENKTQVNLSQAIDHLLENMSAKVYKEKVLEAEK